MLRRYALMIGLCSLCSSCYNKSAEEKEQAKVEQKPEVTIEKSTPVEQKPTAMAEQKKDDVMTLSYVTKDSGLQYRVLNKADASAASPKKGQMIHAHYTGWLKTATGEKGEMFDSSYNRGKPLSFNVGTGRVIKGWDEALLEMKVGEKRELIIPANLAYGTRGAGNIIPPNATLIFEVELCKIDS